MEQHCTADPVCCLHTLGVMLVPTDAQAPTLHAVLSTRLKRCIGVLQDGFLRLKVSWLVGEVGWRSWLERLVGEANAKGVGANASGMRGIWSVNQIA